MPRAPAFPPKWSNRKALRVGYLLGRGMQSKEIAAQLGENTSAETVRRMWYFADLERVGRKRNVVPMEINLTTYERKALGILASKRGIAPAEWLRQIAAAAIRDDLFAAVVDEGADK
jgi:hypothetical protein